MNTIEELLEMSLEKLEKMTPQELQQWLEPALKIQPPVTKDMQSQMRAPTNTRVSLGSSGKPVARNPIAKQMMSKGPSSANAGLLSFLKQIADAQGKTIDADKLMEKLKTKN